MSEFTVAKLDKGSEKYEILVVIGGAETEVHGVITRKDGSQRKFKKGARSSLFAGIELARKTNAKLISEGWTSLETNFSSVASSLYNQELGTSVGGSSAVSVISEKKKPVKKSKPKPPSVKKMLSMKPADLSTLAKTDLENAVEAIKLKKMEKSEKTA